MQDSRSGHPQKATKAQGISVVLEGGRPAAEGNLCISFEKLFDRGPRPGTAEGDIMLSTRGSRWSSPGCMARDGANSAYSDIYNTIT
jgi:hypothetical protein